MIADPKKGPKKTSGVKAGFMVAGGSM